MRSAGTFTAAEDAIARANSRSPKASFRIVHFSAPRRIAARPSRLPPVETCPIQAA